MKYNYLKDIIVDLLTRKMVIHYWMSGGDLRTSFSEQSLDVCVACMCLCVFEIYKHMHRMFITVLWWWQKLNKLQATKISNKADWLTDLKVEREIHHFIPFCHAWIFPMCIYYCVYTGSTARRRKNTHTHLSFLKKRNK